MIEFIDNNAISSSIEQSTFFLNKNFYSYMSFNLNSTEYEITQAVMIVSLTTQDINRDQYSNKLITRLKIWK